MVNFDYKKYLVENKLTANSKVLEETRVNQNTDDRISYLANTLEHVWNMGKGNNSIDFEDLAKSIAGDMFGDDEPETPAEIPGFRGTRDALGGLSIR